MDPTANLHSLHRHEEELRARSLEAIKNDPTLSNHWALVSEAMNVIYAFAMTFRTTVTMNSRSSSSGKRLFNAGELAPPGITGRPSIKCVTCSKPISWSIT